MVRPHACRSRNRRAAAEAGASSRGFRGRHASMWTVQTAHWLAQALGCTFLKSLGSWFSPNRSSMADAPEGLKQALADRYAIEREIGAGGMATVYPAADLKHPRKVAIKVLRPEIAAFVGADWVCSWQRLRRLRARHRSSPSTIGRSACDSNGRYFRRARIRVRSRRPPRAVRLGGEFHAPLPPKDLRPDRDDNPWEPSGASTWAIGFRGALR
jgi:serine/threonine protein kinase